MNDHPPSDGRIPVQFPQSRLVDLKSHKWTEETTYEMLKDRNHSCENSVIAL